MSTKLMPQIPPRPSRSHDQSAMASNLGADLPKVPPRPINRRIERSQSPHRDSFAPSPFNEPIFPASLGSNAAGQSTSSLYRVTSADSSTVDLPRRPSNVTLPSIGQEGNEYADIATPEEDPQTQTRSIANDLHLHAPKPSLPVSSAKQRVSTVTRTDSNQAAALGIGKPSSIHDDKDPHTRSLKTKDSFVSSHSNGTERPPSSADHRHGIPEIGQQVPMYPDAGDVQAPSPSPFATHFAPGIGFHNDGSKPRHHNRKLSGRGFEGPPGSYGLHGHGIIPENKFERDYYQKHPELLKKETGLYGGVGEGRGEWAMSSEDLNKIVRDTASRGPSGLGKESPIVGPPDEQIGFLASEEYATRISSPRPASVHKPSNASQTHVDSPLRKESISAENLAKPDFESVIGSRLSQAPEVAVQSEHEDEVVHVDAPEHRHNKIYGSEYLSSENLGHSEEELALEDYGAPILAADEVAKEPFGHDLHPAVSPQDFRRNSDTYHHFKSNSGPNSAHASQPSSRPSSIHGVPGIRYQAEHERDSHSTPLEDLEEYEPLFPDDEQKIAGFQGKPLTAADKLKRPELKGRKFPSQDIWEDSPNSLHYTATVSSPQLPEEGIENRELHTKKSLQIHEGETPAEAFARRQEELAEEDAQNSDSFLNREKKPWARQAHLAGETRPGLKQRFPSRDIWEDSPDSLMLQTTVSTPQADETEIFSPTDDKSPVIPARPTTGAVVYHQEKAAAGIPMTSEEGRATTGLAAVISKPTIPARPVKTSKPSNLSASSSPIETKEVPPLPLKSKPAVPARPVKKDSKDSADGAPLSKSISASSAKSTTSDSGAPQTKAKPPVPTRPGVGSKIAALQGGFMSDLNKRLQLGPQAVKKEEPKEEEVATQEEKAPLVDARKGRARGPARRAPPAAAAAAVGAAVAGGVAEMSSAPSTFKISVPTTIWEIDPEVGSLTVDAKKVEENSEAKLAPELEPEFSKHEAAAESTTEREDNGIAEPEDEEGGEDLGASVATIKPATISAVEPASSTASKREDVRSELAEPPTSEKEIAPPPAAHPSSSAAAVTAAQTAVAEKEEGAGVVDEEDGKEEVK